MSFESKVVLITGGGTGIGLEVARAVLERGGSAVINGRRAEVLDAAASDLDPSGERVAVVAGSIADPEVANALVATAVERFGGVDILINNAGIFKPTPFLDHGADDLDRYLDIIVKGTFFACQAAIPEIQRRGGGAIVNVGSMWADHAVGATPSSAYSASARTSPS